MKGETIMNLRNFLTKAALVNSTVFCFFGYFVEPSMANEVLTDRCSADVAFPKTYDGNPNSPGTIILSRDSNGRTDWTPPFKVSGDGNGRIRWWCNSTTGNAFDPGTWRVKDVDPIQTIKCVSGIVQLVGGDSPTGLSACPKAADVKIAESNGWTAERSRCDDHSTVIRARLDTGRLLQIECLGNELPLPSDAVVGGYESNGSPLYVCSAPYQNGMYPGKTHRDDCIISYGGKEIFVPRPYNFITKRPGYNYGWVSISNNQPLPPNALPTGFENGYPLYSCRASYQGGIHPGHTSGGWCNFSWGGMEIQPNQFEVLTESPTVYQPPVQSQPPDPSVPSDPPVFEKPPKEIPIYLAE